MKLSKLISGLAIAVGLLASSNANAKAFELLEVPIDKPERIILAVPSGLTVYTFDPDLADGASKCSATCAEKWPPVLLTEAEAATLIPPLGIHVRANGLKQLTLNKKPLYIYFEDRVSGDTTGDGLGGVWHAATR